MKRIDEFPAIVVILKKTDNKSLLLAVAFLVLVVITACSSTSDDNKNDRMQVKTDDFPRLIITNRNIDDFILKSKTTHQHLFNLSIQLADNFLGRVPPQAQNASNVYREIGETMPALGLAFLITNEDKYLAGVEKWIRMLMDVPTWEGSQNLGRSAWVTGIAQLYDWLYFYLDEDLKKQVVSRLKKEAKIIRNTAASTRALSNHLLIETSAIGIVGLILSEDDPDRDVFLNQANQWTEYIIKNAPLDGSWGEGVQYWQYGLGYFLRFLEGAQTSGYHDYFPEYDWLKKTGRFPIHFSVPDNLTRVINFGDCGTDRYIPTNLLYLPASKYKDGVVQDFALKIQATESHKLSWFDFLTFDAAIKPVDYRSVEKEFHHFDDHGFVTMRSSWEKDAALVGFRCGPAPGHANQAKPERLANRGYGPGHQHPDINSFVIYANGTWLAIDPGYIMLKETRNHNTILVNGHGQAGAGGKWLDYLTFQNRDPAPKITFTESTPIYDYVIGNAGNIYVDEAGLEYFERQLMFIKPDIIIIADRLKTGKDSYYDWLIQANEIAEIERIPLGYDIKKTEASLSVIPLLPTGVNLKYAERMLEANDVYGSSNYNKREGLLKTINIQTTGLNTNFLVVLTINKPGEIKPEVSLEDGIIHIVKNGNKYLVNFQPDKKLSEIILDLAGK